jgi:hypothetical protein
MKTYMKLFFVLSLLFCGNAIAQTDLSGTWQGKLAIDQNTKMTIQFILTRQADGSYKAIVNSPDTGGIKDTPASAVKFNAGKLTIDVASLSGSYSGTVGKGAITGEWKQQNSTIPLVLTPYKKPELSSLKPIVGEWVTKLKASEELILVVVFHFEFTKDGKFVATFDQPEQGAKGLALSDVALEGDQVSFKIPIASGEFNGTLKGNSITGVYRVQERKYDLTLVKGKYQGPTFDMPAEAMNRLLGQWAGRVDVPGDIVYTLTIRFEKTKDGKLAAFSDCPEGATYNSSLTNVSLKGDELSFKSLHPAGEFTGKLGANSIPGSYKIGGKPYELNLTKGAKFAAQATQVDIPAEEMKKLLGRWSGKLSVITVVFRFERTPAGKNLIFIDSPEQNIKGQPVFKASMKDGVLSLKMAGAEYSGKVSGNKIDGVLKPFEQNVTVPLSVTKE